MTPTDSQAARLHEVVPPSPVNHRYLFEEWLRQHHPDRPILTVSAADDRYLSPDTSLAWSAWDAAWNTRPREDAGVADEWRPIETAPQGVMILLADMTATEARHWAFVGWKHHWNKDGHVETPSAINRRATHWKHLPQPPALAAALEKTNG